MRILVVTGSSGGHIFPAISFLDTFKDKHKETETLLVLPKKNIESYTLSFDCKIKYLSISPIKLNFNFGNFIAILKLLKGTFESLFILLEFKPDIVVGFGSLVSIPMVLFARLFGIRTLIHEQNVIPGLANKLLAKFTDRIATSFAQTSDYLKNCAKTKIVFTGNPIRKEFKRISKFKALDFLGLSSDKFTILVMGGSLGSHKINIEFLNALSMLSDRPKLQIIHLTGQSDYNLLKESYKDLNINARLFSFLNPMHYAYSACDLVVSRAGATTIAEIIFFKLPAIVIPYPFAYEHQISNAAVLESKGCVIIIKDYELDANTLRNILEKLVNHPDKIEMMHSGYDNMPGLNASDLLISQVLSLS